MSEKTYLISDVVAKKTPEVNELVDELLIVLAEHIGTIIDQTKETEDTEYAYVLLTEYTTRVLSVVTTILRRELEALATAKFIKTQLDEGAPKDDLYNDIYQQMAVATTPAEFQILMIRTAEYLYKFYGIDDFLEKAHEQAKALKDEERRDVI